jgi:hypothetical protein
VSAARQVAPAVAAASATITRLPRRAERIGAAATQSGSRGALYGGAVCAPRRRSTPPTLCSTRHRSAHDKDRFYDDPPQPPRLHPRWPELERR